METNHARSGTGGIRLPYIETFDDMYKRTLQTLLRTSASKTETRHNLHRYMYKHACYGCSNTVTGVTKATPQIYMKKQEQKTRESPCLRYSAKTHPLSTRKPNEELKRRNQKSKQNKKRRNTRQEKKNSNSSIW